MSNTSLTVAVLVAVILAIGGYLYPKVGGTSLFGSTACSNITCLSGGLRLVTDAGGDFESDVAAIFASTVTFSGAVTNNATTTSKNIVVTTSNTATSSIQVGCVQTYATSTATPITLGFFATTTVLNGTAVTSSNGLTPGGFVVFTYGKCPGV